MAEFQKQVSESRPFIGKRFHFEPQRDITAYELAQILKLVSEQTGGTSLSNALDLPAGVKAAIARHFRVVEH
ncbi:hypothetical protein [Methylobacterium sp. CM6257]|jgi:hypothetical protein